MLVIIKDIISLRPMNISKLKFRYYFNTVDKNNDNLSLNHIDLTRYEFIKLTHIDSKSDYALSDKDYNLFNYKGDFKCMNIKIKIC